MDVPNVGAAETAYDMGFRLLMHTLFAGSPSQAVLNEFPEIHSIPAAVVTRLAQVRMAVQRRSIGVAFPHIRVNKDTERAGALRVRLDESDANLLEWIAIALEKGNFPYQKHDGYITFGVSAAVVTQLYLLP